MPSLGAWASLVVTALTFIILLAAIATDFVVPIIPLLQRDFGVDALQAQLIIPAFLSAYAVTQIPCGLAADHFGRLRVLYTGVAVYFCGCLICLLAPSIEVLYVGRFAQGLGAAATAVLSRAIARDLRAGPELARLMALFVAALAAMPLIGPIGGAWLGSAFGWRSVFALITAFTAIAAIACLASLQETHSTRGTERSSVLAAFSQFFNCWQSVWAALMLALSFFGLMAILAAFPSTLVDVYQQSSLAVGPLLSLTMVFFVGASILSRRWVSQRGEMTLIGYSISLFLIAAIGTAALLLLQGVPLWVFLLALMPYAAGIGLLFPNVSSIALSPLPHIAGLAASTLGTIQMLFAFAGSTVAAYLYRQDLSHIAWPVFIASFAICILYLFRPVKIA